MNFKSAISALLIAICFSVNGFAQEQTARDSAEMAQRQLDSLRKHSPSLGTNLFWWGAAAPNAQFWLPVGDNITLGLYPEVRENRLQGDFLGLGINIGYSWWLSKHQRLELEAGLAAGYNTADRYQCAWCGANLGKPTHSPMFTLETISADNLRLQINNDHFIIVQMTETTDALGYPVFTYTKHAQTLDIPASQEKTTTNFYVVPVSDAVMADPYVKVFLTRLSSSGQPPVNIPFNHNLPGDEDHTSILIYNPGMAEYTANMENHKSSGDVQPSEYWLEEEG